MTTARTIPEWIGKTPDTPVPASVKLRVFNAHDGICHISGIKIRPGDKWELDHVIRLKDGGGNCETNLAPALVGPHRKKSAQENTDQAKTDRIRKKHLGIQRRKGPPMPGTKASGIRRKMSGEVTWR